MPGKAHSKALKNCRGGPQFVRGTCARGLLPNRKPRFCDATLHHRCAGSGRSGPSGPGRASMHGCAVAVPRSKTQLNSAGAMRDAKDLKHQENVQGRPAKLPIAGKCLIWHNGAMANEIALDNHAAHEFSCARKLFPTCARLDASRAARPTARGVSVHEWRSINAP